MMENQQDNKPVPAIEQAEEATAEELQQDNAPAEQDINVPKPAPEIETPRVPDADTEGIP